MITLASAVGALAALAVAHGPAAPPRVVATYPAANARIPAGDLALSVTFDRPMRGASYSFVMRAPGSFPTCAATPTQSADGRTFTLACVVEAGRAYEVGFNSERHHNFAGQDGASATPTVLRFSAR